MAYCVNKKIEGILLKVFICLLLKCRYSSSIILSETREEILSDKIMAIFERKYLKGRDIYDIWWLSEQLKTNIHWPMVKNKLSMYEYEFIPAREADYFQKNCGVAGIGGGKRAT